MHEARAPASLGQLMEKHRPRCDEGGCARGCLLLRVECEDLGQAELTVECYSMPRAHIVFGLTSSPPARPVLLLPLDRWRK